MGFGLAAALFVVGWVLIWYFCLVSLVGFCGVLSACGFIAWFSVCLLLDCCCCDFYDCLVLICCVTLIVLLSPLHGR